MTKNYFGELAGELGWTVEDNMAFGAQAGFPFSLEFEGDGGTVFRLRFVVDGSTKPCVQFFKDDPTPQVDWYADDDEGKGSGVLIGVASLPSDFYAKGTLHTLLDKGTWALRQAGLHPPETCPLCGLGGCDRLAFLDEGYRPTHAACLEHRLQLPEKDERTPRRVKGHYATGIIGAVLGGLIAALPNWAQALSKGSVSAVLYAFIPILAALMYRVFRGKARKTAAGLTVLFSSFFVAFVLELVWYWISMAELFGYDISVAESTRLFFQNEAFLTVLHGMAISLVFLVVGFFPAYILLRGYAAEGVVGGHLVRGSTFVRQSATPWPPAPLLPNAPATPLPEAPDANDTPPPATEEAPPHET